jgi:hypothetical protein
MTGDIAALGFALGGILLLLAATGAICDYFEARHDAMARFAQQRAALRRARAER